MAKYGKKFTFPKNTDITKTYAYRYIAAMWNKCLKIGLDLDIAKEVVKAAVDFGQKERLLHIGAAILNRSDIIDICINSTNKDLNECKQILHELKMMNEYVDQHSNNDRMAYFSSKAKRKGYTTVVTLFKANILNSNFLALSKSALQSVIDNNEQMWIPNMTQILKIRVKLVSKIKIDELHMIFKEDLNDKI